MSDELALPHCPTCRCVSGGTWLAYSPRTFAYRACARCGTTTNRPGPERWWWRPCLSVRRGYGQGRATESACQDCARLHGATP